MRTENGLGGAGRPRGEKDIGRISLRNERFRDGMVLIADKTGALSHLLSGHRASDWVRDGSVPFLLELDGPVDTMTWKVARASAIITSWRSVGSAGSMSKKTPAAT